MNDTSKESAVFVFEGKVKKTKASNVKAVASSNRTVVATIERVERGPEPLVALSGSNVTVQLAEGEQVKPGQRAVFYTKGMVFGENLAVQSLGHDDITSGAAAAAADATTVDKTREPAAARAATHKKIRERAAEAPVVITGKVIAVGLPASGDVATAAAADAGEPRRVSEHEPFWREAVVEVQQVHKGTVGKKQVVLRFPSSTDVRWHQAPKFEPGQEGVFSLHPDKVSRQPARGAVAASFDTIDQDTYTCLNRADFQPAHNEAEAAAAIDGAQQ
jgi:hypothetical protein